MQSRGYLPDLSVSNIDFFAVEFLTGLMLPYLDDFADTDVHLGDFRHVGSRGSCSLRLWRLLLLLLLLRLLLALFLVTARSCSSTSCIFWRLLFLLVLTGSISISAASCLLSFSFLGSQCLSLLLKLTL